MKRKKQADHADAVVRVSIAGLDEEAAVEAIKKANSQALSLLRIPTRRFAEPTMLRFLDSKGRCIAAFSKSTRYLADLSSKEMREPNLVTLVVIEDARGRKASVRVEIER